MKTIVLNNVLYETEEGEKPLSVTVPLENLEKAAEIVNSGHMTGLRFKEALVDKKMKLIKGEKIDYSQYAGKYKFVLDFMIGDADGWEQVVLHVDQDSKDLERFLDFLGNCQGFMDDNPSKIKDFDYFMGDAADSGDILFDWPYDQMCDKCCDFYTYNVTYFDENGVEYFASVTD